MAEPQEPLRRPHKTRDLINRLQSTNTTAKEKDALCNLCRCMIKTYKDDSRPNYTAEAALLAPVLQHGENHELLLDLITSLGNNIIGGTMDRNILDVNLLKAFAYVLWHTDEISLVKSTLGSVLSSLSTRLKNAKITAEFRAQYQLVCAICAILDSMVDIKASGLSREDLHEPLLKQLKELSRDKDIRLAFASSYAYQALLGIKDDEGPYKALWRYVTTGAQMTADLAGAVSKMDPGALLTSLPAASSVLDLVQKLYEVGANVVEVMTEVNDAKGYIDSLSKISKQRSWYKALRYTELLLQAHAYTSFIDFIKRVPCRSDNYFLCGLYAQLEAHWFVIDSNKSSAATDNLTKVYDQVFRDVVSYEPIVQAWARIAGQTIGYTLPPLGKRQSRNPIKRQTALSTDFDPFVRSTFSESSVDNLLMKVWSSGEVTASKIFYADVSIQHRYKTGKALLIERLSGALLPLEECYINLELINKETVDADPSSFSLEARLRLEATKFRDSIPLRNLFDQRELSNNSIAKPRRIFIQGRAGIGKSTMCKKIVHEFMDSTLGAKEFDRLLWLSLRRLISKPEGYKWSDLIEDELLDDSMAPKDRKDSAEVIGNYLNSEKSFQERTLILLDGLDEVSHRWASYHSMYKVLERLLQMPNLIVTSRPQAKVLDTGSFDLQLETLGFTLEQVNSYIKHSIVDEALIKDVHRFLSQRPLVQGLMRIPIQLDAFCYVWSRISHVSISKISTMTPLYQAICDELGKKDIVRLEKETQVQSLGKFEIMAHLEHEQSFLNEFAFQGLYNSIIEFSPYHQDRIAAHMNKQGIRLQRSYRMVLESLSFLRTSNVDPGQSQQHYHFLHLTFQEFFAAKHWVRNWQLDKQLNCLQLSSEGPSIRITPSDFLAKEKYNPRYNIFWRFVTGLIQMETEFDPVGKGLANFFDELEGHPRDELGYMHHRLLMYALSEVAKSENTSTSVLRRNVERKLYSWTVLQVKVHARHSGRQGFSLLGQSEFPDDVIEQLLHETDTQIVQITLELLSDRSFIPPQTLRQIIVFIENDSGLALDAVHALQEQKDLSKDIIELMVNLVRSPDQYLSGSARRVLEQQSMLSLDTIASVVPELENGSDCRTQAANMTILQAISKHSYLDKWRLIALLKPVTVYQYWKTEIRLVEAFVKSFTVPQDYSMADIFDCFSSSEVKCAVKNVFAWANHPIDGLLNLMSHLTRDKHAEVRLASVKAFRRWRLREDQEEQIGEILLPLLDDPNLDVREATVKFFEDLKSSPSKVQEALTEHLLNANTERNDIAIRILTNSCDQHIELDMRLMFILQRYVRIPVNKLYTKVVRVLCWQSRLPEVIGQSVCAQLESDDDTVVKLTLDAILGCIRLHPLIVTSVSKLLNRPGSNLLETVSTILIHQSELPEAIVRSLDTILLKTSTAARVTVVQARRYRWGEIAAEIEDALAKSLKDPSDDIRIEVIYSLMDPTVLNRTLRSWMLDEKKDYKLRILALEHLQGPSFKARDLDLSDLETVLKDKDPRVVQAAMEAMDRASRHDSELFPFFMEHLLNHCLEPEQQISELEARNGTRAWIPSRHAVHLWEKVPAESLTLIARVLHRSHFPEITNNLGFSGAARQILEEAPELFLQTWEVLAAHWNDDNRVDISEHRVSIMQIVRSKSSQRLPTIVKNLIVNFLSDHNLEKKFPDEHSRERTIRNASKTCVQQMKRATIDINTVARILNTDGLPKIVDTLMDNLVQQNLDVEFFTLLNDKALAVMFEIWLDSAYKTELSCYRRNDGLYLYRDGLETRLDLDAVQVDRILRIIAEVRTNLGFCESSLDDQSQGISLFSH